MFSLGLYWTRIQALNGAATWPRLAKAVEYPSEVEEKVVCLSIQICLDRCLCVELKRTWEVRSRKEKMGEG